MRRLLVIGLMLAAGAAAVVASASAGSQDPQNGTYTLELDNAFGIVEGADVKVAGVRAGRITGMRVDRRTKRALVDFAITQNGFGSLRTDAFCETRPQSLIGEYFVDCRPGTASERLEPGATIPVEQTASTIPIDLINNIMRRPYRERLGIILNELGAGVGGRASDIQETVRRAVPALRETDRVLAILAEQNQVLGNLTRDADAVIGDLADNRKDVGRFVTETRADRVRLGRAAGGDRRQPAPPPDLPRRARADHGPARPGRRRAVARRSPTSTSRPASWRPSSSSCPSSPTPAARPSSRSPSSPRTGARPCGPPSPRSPSSTRPRPRCRSSATTSRSS